MGFFRFSRRFRITPGLRINVSKSGVSESVGRRGAWFTLGPRGSRTTVGIPGSGLSYTETARSSRVPWLLVIALLLFLAYIFS